MAKFAATATILFLASMVVGSLLGPADLLAHRP